MTWLDDRLDPAHNACDAGAADLVLEVLVAGPGWAPVESILARLTGGPFSGRLGRLDRHLWRESVAPDRAGWRPDAFPLPTRGIRTFHAVPPPGGYVSRPSHQSSMDRIGGAVVAEDCLAMELPWGGEAFGESRGDRRRDLPVGTVVESGVGEPDFGVIEAATLTDDRGLPSGGC